MMKGKKILLLAALAAVAALAVGAGYAFAQEDAGPQDEQLGPSGPGGGWGRPGRARAHMLAGEVISVSDGTITLKTFWDEEKSVKVDDDTKYLKADGEASIDDVKQGEKIAVALNKSPEGEQLTARAVIIGNPRDMKRGEAAVGEVVAVDGDKVTIKTADGDKQFTLPEITQGSRLGVMTGPDGDVRGVIYNPPERPQGGPEGEAPPEGGGA